MYLTKNNYQTKLQENALMNHTDVEGLFEKYHKFKPGRLPYDAICELVENGSVGINVCTYGDLIYTIVGQVYNPTDYVASYKHIKKTLEKHGYWIASFRGNIYKDLDNGECICVGEIR